uniref:AlNc14C286G10178 protein n=1 Tax=Albugo laibachii Nc14 TaxID=890382 RepID=F0WV35_9STRA|nr:AlNc14C286G10178 [Albugo laibachii Nc14]|eukprot:CCA25272.1 AlNc14C286G10178 [Albugo laibachii Nc14]
MNDKNIGSLYAVSNNKNSFMDEITRYGAFKIRKLYGAFWNRNFSHYINVRRLSKALANIPTQNYDDESHNNEMLLSLLN